MDPRCTLPLRATLVEELVEEPIAVEVEMGGIIEVLSPRDQKLMKQIIIAQGHFCSC